MMIDEDVDDDDDDPQDGQLYYQTDKRMCISGQPASERVKKVVSGNDIKNCEPN